MRYDILDNNAEYVDTIECTMSLDGIGIMVDGIKYPIAMFQEAYTIAEKVDHPYNFWSMKIDPILTVEVEHYGYPFDRYAGQEYDGLQEYEL